MHELSVTENILKIVLRHAQDNQAKQVVQIHLVIGQFASIVDDSVQFYWDIVSQGTIAEGARLHFKRIPAELVCQDCQRQYTPTQDELACPSCNSIRVTLVRGDEFYLEAIEVEGGPPTA